MTQSQLVATSRLHIYQPRPSSHPSHRLSQRTIATVPTSTHNMSSKTYECVVIGAGFAGLMAARGLVNQGRSVLVLEVRASSHLAFNEPMDGFGNQLISILSIHSAIPGEKPDRRTRGELRRWRTFIRRLGLLLDSWLCRGSTHQRPHQEPRNRTSSWRSLSLFLSVSWSQLTRE